MLSDESREHCIEFGSFMAIIKAIHQNATNSHLFFF